MAHPVYEDLDFQSSARIAGLLAPAAGDEPATKDYVDALSAGMFRSVTQATHGFAVGDLLYHNGSTHVKSRADVAATAEVLGMVSAVAGANDYTLQLGGYITGLSGLTAGLVYYLSTSTAGAMQATAPSGVVGQVDKPVFFATSTTAGYIMLLRGVVITSAGSSPGNYVTQTFSAQTSVSVPHGFGVYPIVKVIDNNGEEFIPQTVDHATDKNSFVMTFSSAKTGTVIVSAGGAVGTLGAHAHGNITNAGAIGTTAGLSVVTGPDGVLTTGMPSSVWRNEAATAHGFVVGELVYRNGATWTKSRADDPDTAGMLGMVSVSNTNDFDLTTSGYVSGLTGLTANTLYYMSTVTAGAMSATKPSTGGHVDKPVFFATSTTAGYLLNERGIVIGGGYVAPAYAYASSFAQASTTVVFSSLSGALTTSGGAQYLTCAINPVKADSSLEIMVNVPNITANGVLNLFLALFKDSETSSRAMCAVTPYTASYFGNGLIRYILPSTGSTATQTWRLYFGSNNAGTVYMANRGAANEFGDTDITTMTISEKFNS